jgi:nanoRNase/pAp phosphatase (c-di-AMP/oligoRNAs hydrolase)
MTNTKKYRLVMRSDFDGIVCAVLLRKMDLIDDILFVHPKDMQDGKVQVTSADITANVPFIPGVYLAFDHHLSEKIRLAEKPANLIIDPNAPSTARVVYRHCGGQAAFPDVPVEMIEAVDKADGGQFSRDEVLHPQGWVLLHFLMDPRTGLGRFHNFRISNYNLMRDLIGYCEQYPVEKILELPDVRERVHIYFQHEESFKSQIQRCAHMHDGLIVLDLRSEEMIYPGNRFMVYALYPECAISMHVLWGKQKQNVVLAVGKSIFNRRSATNIGELMLRYGGGGHASAGTCQVEAGRAEDVLKEVIQAIVSPASV